MASLSSSKVRLDARAQTVVAGRYRVLALLGVGGMGSVYRARDLELEEDVALKVLRRDLVGHPGVLERFRREVKLARRVTHPNVARTFDIGEHEGERFLTMELVEGESLAGLLDRETRLPVERVVEIAVAICHGLTAAHAAGVVHRDLKPDNVLLGEGQERRVVITDFGVARACLDRAGPLRTSGLAIGTPEYMAPEQVEASAHVDGRTDLYALGVMLFEMLVGERPWTGDSAFGIAAARLVRPPPDPREQAEVPDALARVVLRCMARDPAARYARAEEVANALSGMTLPAGLVIVKLPSIRPPAHRLVRATRIAVVARDVEPAPRTSGEVALPPIEALADLVATTLSTASGIVARVTRDAATVERAMDATLCLELRRSGDALDVTLQNVEDGFRLWSGSFDDVGAAPFSIAHAIAASVSSSLGVVPPAALAKTPARRDVVDLWLRARADSKRPESAANDRAIARFERAIGIAPDDPWVNGAYAFALARRFVESETSIQDEEEARVMAEHAIVTAPRMVDARIALATLDLERNEAARAAGQIRNALALDTSRAELHHLHGRVLAMLGDPRAAEAFAEAQRLDEDRWSARWDEALLHAIEGDSLLARRLITTTRTEEETSASYWWTAVRVALITQRFDVLAEVRAGSAQRWFERRDLLRLVLDAAVTRTRVDAATSALRAAAMESADVPRRACAYRVVEAELLAHVGDAHGAVSAIRGAAELGLQDLAWLDHAQVLSQLRTRSPFLAVREAVSARAIAIRSALEASLETLAPG